MRHISKDKHIQYSVHKSDADRWLAHWPCTHGDKPNLISYFTILMPSSTHKPTHMLLTCVIVVICLSSATLAVQVYVPVRSDITWCSVTTFKPFWLVLVTGRSLLLGMRGRNVQVSSGIGDPVAAQSNVTLSPDRASITAPVTDTNSGGRWNGDLGKTSSWPSGLYLDFFVSKFVAIHLPKNGHRMFGWKMR